MALVVLERRTPLDPAEAWERLVDWERHGAFVPLTRLTVTPPPPVGPGTTVVARTGIGRFGFDDPMEVVEWVPPHGGGAGRCRLEKRGRLVRGWAEIRVRPEATGARVEWREDLRVRGVPALADPLLAAAGRLAFGRTVDGLLAHRNGEG
ncbi:SRPBCC family protein [Streptomyces sp. JNUCC 64]